MWRYAIALLLIDDEKARIVETRVEGDAIRLVVQTLAGDQFEVVRPPMSDETEQLLLEQVQSVMEESE